MERTVWQAFKASIVIYRENASGVVVNADGSSVSEGLDPVPLVDYCYVEGFGVSGSVEIINRNVTGRSVPKISRRAYSYSASIEHLAFSLAVEIDQSKIFNRAACLRLIVSRTNEEYVQGTGQENDVCVLKRVAAESFNLSGKGTDIVASNLSFKAEGFELNPENLYA